MARWRIARTLLYLALLFAGLLPSNTSAAGESRAFIMELDGIVDPNHAKFLRRGLERAAKDGGQFVILRIDTPGGLVSSMRDMVESIFASPIPVITFVAPQGAQAGSAGTFVTAAGHVAAMALATNIGAATPIAGGGQDLPETLANKATNDAAALIRSIAEERGRNADKLEETVRLASSFTAQEALQLDIIDLVAEDLSDLIAKLDGRVVAVGAREVTLDTEGIECDKPRVSCETVSLSFVERFIDFIADPNISAILLSLGSLGIFLELLHPGLLAPGIFGAIALALAFVAFGNLPVNWAGVGLMLFALALLFAEVHVSGFGILGIGGLVSFILGAVFLFAPWAESPPSITMPSIHISPWLIAGLSSGVGLTVGSVVYLAWRSRREFLRPGVHRLMGQMGRVTHALDPVGSIQVAGELWSAEEEDAMSVEEGERVQVVRVEGLTLKVRKVPKLLPAGESAETSPELDEKGPEA